MVRRHRREHWRIHTAWSGSMNAFTYLKTISEKHGQDAACHWCAHGTESEPLGFFDCRSLGENPSQISGGNVCGRFMPYMGKKIRRTGENQT